MQLPPTDKVALFWPQLYVHPTDPDFPGYQAGSVFHGAEVPNRVISTWYLSYDLVEAVRSMMAAALQGEAGNRISLNVLHTV